jgi:hypothetical protein
MNNVCSVLGGLEGQDLWGRIKISVTVEIRAYGIEERQKTSTERKILAE